MSHQEVIGYTLSATLYDLPPGLTISDCLGDECTRYELRVETSDIRPVLSLFRLKSRLDEFLGLLSSFVLIKADARRTLNNGN